MMYTKGTSWSDFIHMVYLYGTENENEKAKLKACAQFLFIDKMPSKLKPRMGRVNISVETKLECEGDGLVTERRDPFTNAYKFTVRILRTHMQTMLITLCHEFVHIKQALSGDCVWDCANNTYIWKGTPVDVPYDYAHRSHDKDYRKIPWEKQAYSQERYYYRAFMARQEALNSVTLT